jgi:hypothetical protein
MANHFDLSESWAVLERTPSVLRALLLGLPDAWLYCTEGEGTWSPRDVLAHLTDLEETDWLPRVRLICDSTEPATFAPNDRVRFRTSLEGQNVVDLCVLFAERRTRNLDELERYQLQSVDLSRTGRHPAFGEVTLAQLLAAWAVHDFTHIAQIVRTMAKRYEEAVGPWRDYLGVLNR